MKFKLSAFLLFLTFTPIQASDTSILGRSFSGSQVFQAVAAASAQDETLKNRESNRPAQLTIPSDHITTQSLRYISARQQDRQKELELKRKEQLQKKELKNIRELAARMKAENLEEMRILTMITAGEELRKPVSARKLVSIKNQLLPFLNVPAHAEDKKLYTILSTLESALYKKNVYSCVDRTCWCPVRIIVACCIFSCSSCDIEPCLGYCYNCQIKQDYYDDCCAPSHSSGCCCTFCCGDNCVYYTADQDTLEKHRNFILDGIDSIVERETNKRIDSANTLAIINNDVEQPVQVHTMMRDDV